MKKLLDVNLDKRVYGLDVFRAIAILIVVRAHGREISGPIFDFINIPMIDGVELFFVLSGFLIGSIFIKMLESQEGLSFSSLFQFWKRRWFRTLPNYFLILLTVYLLVRFGLTGGKLEGYSYKFIFFIHNFHEGFHDFFWESWSLSIEEWFYIFFPFLTFLLLYFYPKRKALLISIITLIVVPLLYRIAISDMQVVHSTWDIHFRKVVLTRLDTIIYGVLAAYIKFYYSDFWSKSKNWMFIIGLILLYGNRLLPKDINGFYAKTFFFNVSSIGGALLLAKADSIKNFKHPWFGRSITFISLISYSMYLINLSVVALVLKTNLSPESNLEFGFVYILYWAITIVVSALLYKFFEKPIMNLRDR